MSQPSHVTRKVLTAIDTCRAVPVNLRIGRQRTSVRLDPSGLEALDRLAQAEGISRNRVAELVHERLGPGMSLASALRAFVLAYWLHRAEFTMEQAVGGEGPPQA